MESRGITLRTFSSANTLQTLLPAGSLAGGATTLLIVVLVSDARGAVSNVTQRVQVSAPAGMSVVQRLQHLETVLNETTSLPVGDQVLQL